MEDRLGRILVAWVDAAQRHARAILVWTGVVTIALLGYAALALGVNMHHTAIVDDDLPFWKHYHDAPQPDTAG